MYSKRMERCVNLVTEPSKKCYSENSRDSYIRSKLESRLQTQVLDTKKNSNGRVDLIECKVCL